MNDVTLLCVNYYTAKFIRFQQWCLRQITSPETTLRWFIIDNTPDDSERHLLSAQPDTVLLESNIREEFSHDKIDPKFSPRSSQHALALNALMEHVKTPYGLIIDPDCFVTCIHWDSLLFDALRQTGAPLIGAPYHPSRRLKYGQNFPTVTFMLFEAKRFLPLGIDFRPGLYPDLESIWYRSPLLKRFKHGTWKDTGWQTSLRFREAGLQAVCFDAPILRPHVRRSPVRRFLSHLVPEAWLTWPRHPFERPDDGLIAELQLYRAPGHERYEEYYFRNKFFLCHLRGIAQLKVPFESRPAQFWIRRIAAHLQLDYGQFVRSLKT